MCFNFFRRKITMTTLNGKINLAFAAITSLGATVNTLSATVTGWQGLPGTDNSAMLADLEAKIADAQEHLTKIDGEIGTEADDAPAAGAQTPIPAAVITDATA